MGGGLRARGGIAHAVDDQIEQASGASVGETVIWHRVSSEARRVALGSTSARRHALRLAG
jgi:hypothetical protein